MGKANFIVSGYSYGQGSSREHAAICPMYLGVKAVLALSIERIHQANLCNFGILPLTFKNVEDYERINVNDNLIIENTVEQIENKSDIVVKNTTQGYSFVMELNVSELQRKMLLCGGRLNSIKGGI